MPQSLLRTCIIVLGFLPVRCLCNSVGPTSCSTNSDVCLQGRWSSWFGTYDCAGSGDYCIGNYASDMLECCPAQCVAAGHDISDAPCCAGISGAPCQPHKNSAPTSCSANSDSCLQDRWSSSGGTYDCAGSEKYCSDSILTSSDNDMRECCPAQCAASGHDISNAPCQPHIQKLFHSCDLTSCLKELVVSTIMEECKVGAFGEVVNALTAMEPTAAAHFKTILAESAKEPVSGMAKEYAIEICETCLEAVLAKLAKTWCCPPEAPGQMTDYWVATAFSALQMTADVGQACGMAVNNISAGVSGGAPGLAPTSAPTRLSGGAPASTRRRRPRPTPRPTPSLRMPTPRPTPTTGSKLHEANADDANAATEGHESANAVAQEGLCNIVLGTAALALVVDGLLN